MITLTLLTKDYLPIKVQGHRTDIVRLGDILGSGLQLRQPIHVTLQQRDVCYDVEMPTAKGLAHVIETICAIMSA